MDKPLFIPLKTEYFEAFERGDKTTEYRLYGPRWNEKAVQPGRPVVLSKGYGKANRLCGRVASVQSLYSTMLAESIDATMRKLYGDKEHLIFCIEIADIKRPNPTSGE